MIGTFQVGNKNDVDLVVSPLTRQEAEDLIETYSQIDPEGVKNGEYYINPINQGE
jgi:hypothetical protein